MISLQDVRIAGTEDGHGKLVFSGGALIAILVQLSEVHGIEAGSWNLEIAFPGLVGQPSAPFFSIDDAMEWLSMDEQSSGVDPG